MGAGLRGCLLVGVDTAIADRVAVALGDVFDHSGEEVGRDEDFRTAFGFPIVAGAVDDGGVPLAP